MRILTVTNAYPPHYYGGYELTCADVMQRFAQAGHEVTVLTSTLRVPGVDSTGDDNVRRTLHAYWDWEKHRPAVPRSPWQRFRVEQANLRALDAALRESEPDVVSVWHHGGLSMGLLTVIEQRRLPMLLTVANDWLVAAPRLDGWSRMWLRWSGPLPTRVGDVPVRLPTLADARANFVSEFTKGRSNDGARWRFPDAPIFRPGVDLRDFPVVAAAPSRPWRWRVLYVGRIDPVKGLGTLLRAVAQLPQEATLEVIGGGHAGYRAELEALARELQIGDRLRFLTAPRAQLRAHYLDADVVVFPSEWDEPFGVVPLEAMACGTPVVATGTGGSGEFLTDGRNCLRYPAGDVDALAACVRRLAAEQSVRQELATGGLVTAAQLTTDAYAANLLELHEQVARDPRG